MDQKKKKMRFFQTHWLRITGVAVGLLGGYLYYHYVGCLSGTCPITSNPYRMMLYGAVLGYLLFDIFSNESRHNKKKVTVSNEPKNQIEQ